MTMAQFRIWVKTLDADKDGKISKDELADAVRGNGGWFAGWKGKRGVKAADANGNGVIDDSEIDMLAAFAQKHLARSYHRPKSWEEHRNIYIVRSTEYFKSKTCMVLISDGYFEL
ncbi:hypothetical protein NC652_006415 [Populus alba x Populus x berolinensis]|nr:hypothetical protein NC652_006415 [Populus alba x Populus x berolinensis]